MLRRSLGFMGAVLVLATVGGCGRPSGAPVRVDGRNFGAFYYWRSSVSSQFTPAGWRDFNAAIEELRVEAMGRGVTGSDAIDQALCDRINGRTIPEVLLLADEARLARLERICDKLKVMVDANALIAAVPGSLELADVLAARRAGQEARLRATIAEIATARKLYIAHGGTPVTTAQADASPARLSREEALAEFTRMIESRRQLARDRYGDWPADIDRAGTNLTCEDQDAFRAGKRAAQYNGHVVIPVYIRARWRVFDAPVTMPDFSDAVMGNLTADDRQEVAARWADSEAEIWARREASKESVNTAVANIKSSLKGMMR